ncbi:gag-pol polyprotein [Cucumis melo var. makuwa]|uniref:Gag-pol polyprotein n=1 Tax=Cucumis melo var. makuwa TaxID=1194695 RepID=A0A5A7USJ4_CUCMM|nr:gag-pol polyprotein [Cucumis melo var. makuwa]
MSEDESVSEYNERVLEIANESLLLGENIPDSKIVRKIDCSKSKPISKKDGENTTRRYNEVPNRKGSDYGKKKEDEDTDDNEDDSGMNAFAACIRESDFGDGSECSEENCDEELTFEELKVV